MTPRYLITGAAGFIGTNLVRALNARGEEDLLLTDHLGCSEKWSNLVGTRFEDYLDREDLLDLLERNALPKFDAVFHLGACSATTEKDSSYLMENNYRYTRTLCEWCLRNEVRFVYASSAATYGDGAQGYCDDDDVTPSLRPLNMYGYSKHLFDLWALKNKLFDRIAGLKYFNVYGPYENHKDDMRSVVHKAWGQVCETGKVKLFKSDRPGIGDGEQDRDFVYVKDAARLTLALGTDFRASGLFNCGTGQARTWNDLVKAVFAALDTEPNIEYIDMPAHLKGKYQYHTEADMRKLTAAGWTTPFTRLEDGVDEYVRSYLNA